MKVTFIGQAGYYVETDRAAFFVDPYLSDSIGETNPEKHRRIPVREEYFQKPADFLLFTHEHQDHYDPETVEKLMKDRVVTTISPMNTWKKLRALSSDAGNNHVLLNHLSEWSEKGIRFRAVRAFHSDETAVGFLVLAEGKTLYFTGDTLYNERIFADIDRPVDAVFLPVNGHGNNMNAEDALRFAERIRARQVFPNHFGMLDDVCKMEFPAKSSIVLSAYETVVL